MKKTVIVFIVLLSGLASASLFCPANEPIIFGDDNAAMIFSNGHDLVLQTREQNDALGINDGAIYVLSGDVDSINASSQISVIAGNGKPNVSWLGGASVLVSGGIGSIATQAGKYGGAGGSTSVFAGAGGYCSGGESSGDGGVLYLQGGPAGYNVNCPVSGNAGWVQINGRLFSNDQEGISGSFGPRCRFSFSHGLLVGVKCPELSMVEKFLEN